MTFLEHQNFLYEIFLCQSINALSSKLILFLSDFVEEYSNRYNYIDQHRLQKLKDTTLVRLITSILKFDPDKHDLFKYLHQICNIEFQSEDKFVLCEMYYY